MWFRVLAFSLFIGGGIFTWFVLRLLRALAASQSGMSAVPIPGPLIPDAVIADLFCSYFAASAIGAFIARTKIGLLTAAGLSHLLLLLAFCAIAFSICYSDGSGSANDHHFAGILRLAVIVAVFYSPWLCLWVLLLVQAADHGNESEHSNQGTSPPSSATENHEFPPRSTWVEEGFLKKKPRWW